MDACMALAAVDFPVVVTAELDDVIKGLVLLTVVLGPLIRKLIASLGEARALPHKPSLPGTGGPKPIRRGTVTWEELMRGEVPETPPESEIEPEPDRTPRSRPAPEPVAADPEWELETSSMGFEPLSEIPSEGELEREGFGQLPSSTLSEVDPRTAPKRAAGSGSDPWGGRRERSSASRLRAKLRKTGWRDAVLVSEVLGPPLALRSDWSHPGPHLGKGS